MRKPEVHSLAAEALDSFLDRRRYSVFAPARLRMDALLREILSKANDFVPSAAGSILMDRPHERDGDPANTTLYFVAAFGPAGPGLLGKSLRADRGVVGHVYRTGTSYLMADPQSDPNFYAKFDEGGEFLTASALAVPIRIERTVCGVLELINRLDGQCFVPKDMDLLEIFARYTSVSIANMLDAQRANEMARRDDLTGLHNDRFFHHRLTEDLVRADLNRSNVGLLFLDLDNFKDVNDTHGHLAGSQVLKEFGYLLSKTVCAEAATLARYGGDEFVIILPDHDLDDALKVANEVLEATRATTFLRGNYSWAEEPVHWSRTLTASMGVAVYPLHVARHGSTDMRKNLLLRAADQAMYAAKSQGKNRLTAATRDEIDNP